MKTTYSDDYPGIAHTVIETPDCEIQLRFLKAAHGGLCIADVNSVPIIATKSH